MAARCVLSSSEIAIDVLDIMLVKSGSHQHFTEPKMRILLVTLTAAEAANSAVMSNLQAMFDAASDAVVTTSTLKAPAPGNAPPPLLPPSPPVPPVADAAPQSTALVAGTPTAASVFGDQPPIPPAPPTPPAPQPAAAPPAPTPPATGAPVDLDTSGLPWDHRIHAKSDDGSKPKNADGTWRKKRGGDKSIVAAVEAELRAALAANAAVAGTLPPGPPMTPPALPPAPPQQQPLTAEQIAQIHAAQAQQLAALAAAGQPGALPPPPPIAPGLPPAPPVAPAAGAAAPTFQSLMLAAQDAQFAGVISANWFLERRAAYQVPSLPALMQMPAVVAAISMELDEVWRASGKTRPNAQ